MEKIKRIESHINSNEEKAMKLAEANREEWQKTSFFKEIFMGNFLFHLIDPFPAMQGLEGAEYLEFYKRYEKFLIEEGAGCRCAEYCRSIL